MERRTFLKNAALMASAGAVLQLPRARAAGAWTRSVDYGYATNPFTRLKGDGSPATFDEAVNSATSVSSLSFDAVRAVRCATSGAVTTDVGAGRFNPFVQPADWNGGVSCAVAFENIRDIDFVTLYLGSSDYGSVYHRSWGGAQIASGWNVLAVPAREFDSSGGSLSPAMARTKLRVVTRRATVFHIAYFAHYQRARSKVLLMCDDGYDEHFTYLKPQLVARSIPCAFAIDASAIDQPSYMTRSQLQSLHDDPSRLFTLVNHGMRNEALTAVGVGQYMRNVEECRTALNSWGCGNGKSYHVYVQGMFDDAAIHALRQEGFHSAREVGSSDRTAKTATRVEIETMTMLLPASCNLEETQPLSLVRSYLAHAIQDGGTFVIMGHRFDPSSGGTIQWTETDMNSLLDDLVMARERRDVDLVSWPDWYRGLSRGS